MHHDRSIEMRASQLAIETAESVVRQTVSTRTWVVIGIALLITAALIRYVGVPFACRLPEGFTSTQRLTGEYRALDPSTFDLGAPSSIDAQRDTDVERTDGSTAVIRSTTALQLPSGPVTSVYHYAVDRTDFSQTPAPSGTKVKDQLGGMVISRAVGADADSFKVYNPALDKTQRMTFTGQSEIHGRKAYGFSGTASGVIADPQLAAPYQAAIAQMAKTGDGSTMPKLLLEMIASGLPARYSAGLNAVLPNLPDEVPIRFTIDDVTSMALDQQLGAPITLAAQQTTVLNVLVDFKLVPVLPLSMVSLHSTDESATEAAQFMNANGWKLTVLGTYLPITLVSAAIVILLMAVTSRLTARRHRRGFTARDVGIHTRDEAHGPEHEHLELVP
ncbi:porin PorA family protein [Nocardia sp. NPDC056611]|uniref:porin PorA family protein n=1 Tax=Nocardia sp. NPDC056611 TaxID=3345877 RepID=UPI003670DD3B